MDHNGLMVDGHRPERITTSQFLNLPNRRFSYSSSKYHITVLCFPSVLWPWLHFVHPWPLFGHNFHIVYFVQFIPFCIYIYISIFVMLINHVLVSPIHVSHYYLLHYIHISASLNKYGFIFI